MEKSKVYFTDLSTVPGNDMLTKLEKLLRRAGIGQIDFDKSEKQLEKTKAIIYSMTIKERRNPALIIGSSSRKKRIALGAGATIQEVNKLIKGYEMMKKNMKQMKSLTKKSKKGGFGKFPFMS